MISFNSCGAKSLPLQRMRQSESLKRLQYVVDLWRKRERWLLCQMSTFLAEKNLWGHGGTMLSYLWKRGDCSDNQRWENSSSNKCATSKGTLFLWGSLNSQKYLWATSRVAEQAKSYRDLMYPTSRHNFYVTLKQKPMVDLRPCHISFCDTIHGGPLTTRAWYWNFLLGIEYQFYC